MPNFCTKNEKLTPLLRKVFFNPPKPKPKLKHKICFLSALCSNKFHDYDQQVITLGSR